MKNPKLLLKILNLFDGILVAAYLAKIMHWFAFLRPVTVVHLIILVFIIYGIKSWVEVKYNLTNPIKTNRVTRVVYYLGVSIFIFGMMFKIMHWPFSAMLLITGTITISTGLILSFVIEDETKESNPEILDDI